MKPTGRAITPIVASVCILIGAIAAGCTSGPPTPTMQTAHSGGDPKQMLNNVQNSNMPEFFKQKRMKVLQSRINNGG